MKGVGPKPMVTVKKFIALLVVGGPIALLSISFIQLVQPAAAREVQAACRGLRPSSTGKSFASFPSVAPNFRAQDEHGKMVALSDFRGQVVLVNFWASWCEVCKAEKPALEALQGQLSGESFVTLALASDTDWHKARIPGSRLKILLDPPAPDETLGRVAKSYGITAVPETFVIDKMGRIRHYFINRRDWNSSIANTCIQALIDE